jgi:large subunit ribosomal protein L9
MKVILLRDVARIGRRYEIKEVPSGHALNFLIPKKLAEVATPENVKRVHATKSKHAEDDASNERDFLSALEVLGGNIPLMEVHANAQGHLFKGIKAEDIVEALGKKGITLMREWIQLSHPLKSLGDHEIPMALRDTRGTFTLRLITQ